MLPDEHDVVRAAYAARAQEYAGTFGVDAAVHEVDAAFVLRHLGGPGRVLDLGCGPGWWSARLHRLGADVTGIDLVPEFVEHARAHHPGPEFRLGSMTAVPEPPGSATGLLSWYSTIHLPPDRLAGALAEFRRLLAPGGVLVLGHFAGGDEVAPFDHAVTTAYRWPTDLLSAELAQAGLVELERLQRQVAERPDRTYAAVAARAA